MIFVNEFDIVLASSFLIENSFLFLFLCFSSQLRTGNSFLGRMISQTKHLKKSFHSFNSVITKICVAVRLSEDERRMGGIEFQLSPS